MAEPGATELVTTTLRLRTKKIKDNVTNYNILSNKMEITRGADGRSIFREMSYAQNGTFKRYSGAEVLDISYNPTMTAAEFEPKQFAVAVTITGREKRMNSGPEGLIKLLGARMKIAEATLQNYFNGDMYSDGSADSGKQIGGLKLLIAKTPTTGTVGAINRASSDSAFYRNYKFDTSADWANGATSAGNVKQLYNKVLNATQTNGEGPDVIIAGPDHFEYLQVATQAIQRITDTKIAKLGYRNFDYQGVPVVLGSSVNYSGQTLIQDDLSYFVNTRGLEMVIYKGGDFDPLPMVNSINQDCETQIICFMGNMVLNQGKTQGVLYDS
jgi:hypothetical protein